ncbi:spore protein [Fervidicella metallireducens AeB]|uniref:Spore protein n=1 Tax=Fervidicella metallireducens AeB TaxID=1403537 RepID=A0A017RRP9_9CLOT|nr:alpha/beta-type small acid-soluble spore protein [Fervidicella metallireducens]EYE87438.1 spore protein [Fervidicella metallireducens AeB]
MSSRNQTLVPEAKGALNKFKNEVAEEIGLHNYDEIDKGELPSRANGYVGGLMVRKMVESYEKKFSK